MELIAILVIIVSILTLLSGLTIFLGAEKFEKKRSLMFFLATFFAAIWSFAIIVFLTLQEDTSSVLTNILVLAIYIAPLFMVVSQFFYVAWNEKHGKICGLLFLVIAVSMALLLALNHGLLYSEVLLSEGGNSISLRVSWFYLIYAMFLTITLLSFIVLSIKNAKKASSSLAKKGRFFYAVSLTVSSAFIIIFSLILPVFSIFRAIWVGPLALSFVVIVHFYAVLRYRLLFLSNVWLKIGSYVILVSVAAMLYMVVFFMVFSMLFKIQKLDTELILMNFIMIVIMLLILPIFHEASALMRSLIYSQDINMSYVTKKLNQMATKNVKLKDLAIFLANNLHFKYIGFVIDGKIYGSGRKTFSSDELAEISLLEAEKDEVWQKISGHSKEIFSKNNIVAVAELKNAKGRPFGQILVGEPTGKDGFEKKDLAKLDMVVNLVASIIDSEKRLKV